MSWEFLGLVKAMHRLAADQPNTSDAATRQTFELAQWAQGSQAAASITQMAARAAKGDPKLAALSRERQDLTAEWQRRDKVRTRAISQLPDKRNRAGEAVNAAALTAIEASMANIDGRLASDFPEYLALTRPAPVSAAEVQAQLGIDEALVLLLDTHAYAPTPEEIFVWIVTKTSMRWVRSDLGTPALMREVEALRCGLHAAAWNERGAERCAEALDLRPNQAPAEGQPLPFDTRRAHRLYKALFDEIRDFIAGKHLLVVPSGPLTQLPFQVLVTAPAEGSYSSIPWLAREHAVTVLPAVSSLKALRRVARSSAAILPMIGFGNPLLDGDQGHPQYGDYYKQQAAVARARQSCQEFVSKRGFPGPSKPPRRAGTHARWSC